MAEKIAGGALLKSYYSLWCVHQARRLNEIYKSIIKTAERDYAQSFAVLFYRLLTFKKPFQFAPGFIYMF